MTTHDHDTELNILTLNTQLNTPDQNTKIQIIGSEDGEELLNAMHHLDIAEKTNEKKSTCANHFFLNSEAFFNLLSTFLATGYSIANYSSQITGFDSFYGVSPYTLAFAFPIAVGFAYSNMRSHYAQSVTLNTTQVEEVKKSATPKKNTQLSWRQSFFAYGHYACDIFEGAAFYIMVDEIVGVSKTSKLAAAGVYSGITLFAALGKSQEFINTKNALLKEDEINANHFMP